MTIYSLHIFSRPGTLLYTTSFPSPSSTTKKPPDNTTDVEGTEKLIFGMIHSLSYLIGQLTPQTQSQSQSQNNATMSATQPSQIELIQTSTTSLHIYTTLSGLKICIYTDIDHNTSNKSESSGGGEVVGTMQKELRFVYGLWVDLYVTSGGGGSGETGNFERELFKYVDGLEK